MAVDLNNVNYILLKADGSVLTQKMDYYIQQGSIGDKIFFGSVAAQNTDIGIAVCTLPNGEQTTLQGSWDTCTYEGSVIGGFVFTLGSAETNYNGGLMMALAVYRSSVRLVNYPLYAVVNETGLMSDTNTGVTIEEINTYLQYAMSALKINQSILAVDSIALVTDWTVYENGQIVFDKSTGIFHKKIAASPYHEVFRDFVPYTGADKDLDLGTNELLFRNISGSHESRIFMDGNYNLYLITSTGDIILNPDGIVKYGDSEIANKDYVAEVLTNYYLKTQVDSLLATKLDKVTTTSPTALRLYAVSGAGNQQMLNVGENALDIPQRKFNQQINVPLIPSSPDDAASKSYVDSRVSALGSALIYMGTRTVAQLNALTNIQTGDFYNVSDSGTLTQGSVVVSAGDNVAWDGSKWDKLSSDIDLSAYYNKTETDDLLDEKQDTLVSGTNIKSINNQSLLGSGDITIQAGAIEKTGAELEDMTYVEGQLYYCTSASESFSADTLYMATGENTIVRFTQTTVNTAPAITAFSVSPTTTEYGNTINCTYTYTLKKYSAISDVKLDGTIISATPSSANGSGTSAVAHDNHTFALTATYSGGTLSRTASITALYRQFYGVASGDTIAQVLTNLKDVQSDTSSLKTILSNNLPSSISLSLGSTPVYVYLIVRSNLTINTLKSGGFDVPFSLVDTQSFTNHYNASYTVRVYRTDNKVFGDMVVNINS